MLFTLQNLGRLEEATIDLEKDLIVLTGPNNTSKTYVAHAIYGFCRRHADLAASASSVLVTQTLTQAVPEHGIVTVDTGDSIRANLPAFIQEIERIYTKDLAEVFAADTSFTERARISVHLDEASLARGEQSMLALEFDGSLPKGGELEQVMVKKSSGSTSWTFSLLPKARRPESLKAAEPIENGEPPLHKALKFYMAFAVGISFFPEALDPYILTSERSGIQLFSRELSIKRSNLVDSMLAAALKGSDKVLSLLTHAAQRYPAAIRDSLEVANDLANLKKKSSSLAPLAAWLEEALLDGTIGVTEEGEMRFRPSGSDGSLGLHLASSSVKSLANLSFYLRHIAEKGRFLIIDEPELNLHPQNQRKVARLLARLVRAGIKVMISTHSDYIVRELNNLIMLSADKDGALRKKYGYDEEEILEPGRVGAYLFDGARAHPIPVEAAGIEVAAIDKEIHELNRSSRDIYFSLFDKDEP